MNAFISHRNRYLTPRKLYIVFKYTIYLLLTWNLFLWFQEDYAASSEMFRDGVTWRRDLKKVG